MDIATLLAHWDGTLGGLAALAVIAYVMGRGGWWLKQKGNGGTANDKLKDVHDELKVLSQKMEMMAAGFRLLADATNAKHEAQTNAFERQAKALEELTSLVREQSTMQSSLVGLLGQTIRTQHIQGIQRSES